MKGLNKKGEWIYFKSYFIRLIDPKIVRVKCEGRNVWIEKSSICVQTHFKDFSGNPIYDKDILQYEMYNPSLGITEYHVRYVVKRKDGIFYMGKSSGYNKVPLKEVSSMFINNLKVIGNTNTNDIPEGIYLDEKLTIKR